jgi:hypothetical protein
MITPNKEGVMIWFTIGLMVGGFLGMLLMAILASRKRGDEF